MSSLKNPHAMAYFQEAVAYYIAANKLREIMTTQPPSGLPLRDPTYFLYHHSAELTLKACLLPHGAKIRSRHNIVALFDRCQTKGLLGPKDAHSEAHNLMVLLNGGNYGMIYRYVDASKHVIPELSWVHETVDRLIGAIEPHLVTWATRNNVPGPSNIRLTFGNRPIQNNRSL